MGNEHTNPLESIQTHTTETRGKTGSDSAHSIPFQHLSLLEALPYPAWIKNRRAEYLYANKAYAELIGHTAPHIRGKTDRQIFPQHLHQTLTHSDAQVFQNHRTVELNDVVLCDRKADRFWLSKSPLIDGNNKANGIIGIMKPMPSAPEESSTLPALALKAIKNSNEAIIIADHLFNVIFVNNAFSVITGYTKADVIGQPSSQINTNWLAEEFMKSIEQHLHYHDCWEGETWNKTKDGNLYSEMIKISVARDSNNNITHYIGQFTDNTEQRQAQEKLEFLAFHDPLTGLANRALFLDRVTRCIQMAERNQTLCAVIYLDLNEFKPLNDRFGHPFGDGILKIVSNKLRELVRKSDTVSRQGGDEFAVLLEDTASIEDAILVAQKIITSLRQPMELEQQNITIGASAGIAVYPEHGQSAEKLISNADKAMYAAKFLGGNGYYLYK